MGQIRDLKKGSYILIDNAPCKVKKIQKSKPGKHGSTKARISAVGIFDDQKRNIVDSVNSKCEIPVVERKTGQLVADIGNKLQIMDMEDYNTFEVDKPDFDVNQGEKVEYLESLGQKKLIRKKS